MVDFEVVRYPSISDWHTFWQKLNTVVALAQAGIEARFRLSWQVGVGARLTDFQQNFFWKEIVFGKNLFVQKMLTAIFWANYFFFNKEFFTKIFFFTIFFCEIFILLKKCMAKILLGKISFWQILVWQQFYFFGEFFLAKFCWSKFFWGHFF